MKKILSSIIMFFLSYCLIAQTAGTLTFHFTEVTQSTSNTYNGNAQHVIAIWIQTSTGTFVKTKLRMVGAGTKDHLPTWAVNSGGTASNATSAACNVVSATTGATLSSWTTQNITWDGTNAAGTLVADGIYRVAVQSTWDHGSSTAATETSYFNFTKGPTTDHQTPASNVSLTSMTLDWVPTVLTFTCSTSQVNVLCNGNNTGMAIATASNGVVPFVYTWNSIPAQVNDTAINLTAGTYTVSVTDAASHSCSATVTITQPPLLTYTYASANLLCYGASTGSITVIATGGTGTKQYSINGGVTFQTSNVFNGLPAGTYQIVLKDANNCFAPTQTVVITQPATFPSFTYSSSNILCNGAQTGDITINATGGTGTFQYSKNGGVSFQSSNSFSNLTAATYQLMVKDANNCITPTETVTLTQPSAITSNIVHNNGCFGANNGSASVTALGGTGVLTYNWMPYGGTATTANNLTTGTYTVTITDNNSCTKTETTTITQPTAALTISNTTVSNTDCGATTGQIISTVTGGTSGYNYLWSNGSTTATNQNLAAGNYSLNVTDANGCAANSPILTVGIAHPNFSIAFTAIATVGTAPFFAGFTNSTPSMSNYNFTWYWGDATFTASNSPNVTHTYTYAGFYDVSLVAVNIANGCADTLKRVGYIFVSGTGCSHTAVISPNTNYNGCAGDTLLLTGSTNASSNYVYQWNLNSIPIFAAANNTLAVTQSGYYSLTVIQAGCPITSNVISVSMNTNPPTPLVTASGALIPCVGGSVTLTASPLSGGSYLWNTGATTQSITVNAPGIYSVTESYGTSSCSSSSLPYNLGTTLPVVPLCMVSVDSLSTHNVVVWEKSGVGAEVDSFRIYRETMANLYTNVGSVSNDSLSEFHDYGANPNVTTYKYKLAAIDTCGSISALSDYHNTIHLLYLGNGNLLWTLYGIENATNPVNYYVINRDDTGTGNFAAISSTIPGGNSTYTDINYASYPNARYRVDVIWNISCTPTRSVLTTRSNIIHLGTTVSVSQLELNNSVTISPNPFTEQTTITIGTEPTSSTIKLFNLLGECVFHLTTNNHSVTIDMNGYAKGIYFVEVDAQQGKVRKKVIKE